MTTPVLSVIIISWNVRDLLCRTIASVYRSWGGAPGLEIIVVDNHSHDGSVAMVRGTFPAVRMIANDDNRGFTRGNNQGLAAAQGLFILLLNPDTEVLGDALPRMVAYLQQHPDIALLGPKLLNPDGTVQSSRRRFPTVPVLLLESTWLQSFAPRMILRHYYVQDRSDEEEQDVDWVTGAAMLIRHAVVSQVGGLDEGFFMYSEELDWCRRIKAAGGRIVYYPQAQIIHHEGKSSEQVVAARHLYFQYSKVRYTRKYHGPLLAETLRLWLMGQYLWQIGVESAKWLLGSRRSLRSARVKAYGQVLRSKLRVTEMR